MYAMNADLKMTKIKCLYVTHAILSVVIFTVMVSKNYQKKNKPGFASFVSKQSEKYGMKEVIVRYQIDKFKLTKVRVEQDNQEDL